MVFVMATMAAVAVAGAVMQQMQGDAAANKAAEQYGRKKAAIEVNRLIAQESLNQAGADVYNKQQQSKVQIEQTLMANQAQQEVNAAAAGVEGQSVDIGIVEAAASAARAQNQLQAQVDTEMNKIDAKSRSINVSSNSQDTKMTGMNGGSKVGDVAQIFTAGLMGALQGRGNVQ